VILRREINHRVKNNLQVISSLLYLQATKSDDPKVCDVLRESQLRVQSLSVIYDKLGQHGAVTDIGFAEYVQQMATGLFTAYGVRQETIELKTSVEEIFLDLDTAVPCGLILTELITNALKYAFPEKRKGEVLIDLRSMVDGSLCLTVSDNGVGLPEGFKLGMAKSMGMGLVRDLTRQLNGQIAFHNHHGTTATVVFPVPKS
jgi:two-component sensor histidine kinase